MARLEFFVVSKAVSIDQTTNQISVFEILEEMDASSFPAQIQSLVAISLWRQEQGDQEQDFQLLLQITTPSGTSHDFRTNFRLSGRRHRVTQRIEGMILEKEGVLRFEVILNDQHAAEHIVDILRTDPIDVIKKPVTPD